MYPVRYEADFIEPQSRAKAFFRLILVIPWAIVGYIYSIGAQIVALIAWFAILFTGRYPESFHSFQAGFLRFTGRLSGFAMLQTEEWPPFGMEDDRSYPIRVDVDPPLPKYNRWKTFFRLILGIPVIIMVSLFQYLYFTAAMIAWLHIVFMGRTSGGIHNALSVGLAYQLRATAYFLLVTETLPPISDQEPASSPGAPARKALATASTAAVPKPAAPAKAPAKKAAAKKPAAAAKKAAAKKSAAKPAAKKSAARRKPTGGQS